MTTFDKYLLRELIPPLVTGMGLALSSLHLYSLFKSQIRQPALGLGADLLLAVLYSLPPTVGLLIPIGLLFSTLVTLGRLEQDRELWHFQQVAFP